MVLCSDNSFLLDRLVLVFTSIVLSLRMERFGSSMPFLLVVVTLAYNLFRRPQSREGLVSLVSSKLPRILPARQARNFTTIQPVSMPLMAPLMDQSLVMMVRTVFRGQR